jgi:hypothetical protein
LQILEDSTVYNTGNTSIVAGCFIISGHFSYRIMCPEWSDMSTRGLLFQ